MNRKSLTTAAITLGILAVLIFTNCSLHPRNRVIPRNIILFIGDGMGVSHITAARITTGRLAMDRFKIVGLITTHTSDGKITDSAAGSTAMATGHKTFRRWISIAPDSTHLKTVFEYAEGGSKSTGLVSTSSVTHATPAAFVSHAFSRGKQTEIAEQIAACGIDVLFGGGLGYFLPQSDNRSRRKDDLNLISFFEDTYSVDTTLSSFRESKKSNRAVALLTPRHLPPASERNGLLREMTEKAISILSRNENGFILMVEGSQIDWEAHDHDTQGIIEETLDFDQAVSVGLDFAKHDGKTLILVTADHETGGFAVSDESVQEKTVAGAFTTRGHTATMIPFFSYGPGSARFGGIHDNTFIGKTLIEFIQ